MVLAPIGETLFGHGVLPAMPLVAAVLGWLAVSANWTAVTRIRHTMRALETPAAAPTVQAPVVPMRRNAATRN
jgi:hypothetical protein